jgi:hypothetical protein
MPHNETIGRCANFLRSTYEALDDTHDENKARPTETLDGDDFNVTPVLRAWLLASTTRE